MTMFFVTLIISLICLYLIGAEYFVLKAFGLSAIATVLEAISIAGLDNISVPIVLLILVYLIV